MTIYLTGDHFCLRMEGLHKLVFIVRGCPILRVGLKIYCQGVRGWDSLVTFLFCAAVLRGGYPVGVEEIHYSWACF